MDEYKNLLLKSNRGLGSSLVKIGLIDQEQLDKANELFLSAIQEKKLDDACLLKFLMFNINAFDESEYLKALTYPLIDLRSFEICSPSTYDIELGFCRATYTFPFDKDEDYIFVASNYILSSPVFEEWERLSPGKIVWHVTSIEALKYAFDQASELHEAIT